MRTIEHWIGGRSAAGGSGRVSPVWDPATGEQQAEVVLADPSAVDAAVAAAATAFHDWSQTSLSRRASVLFAFRELVRKHADELAELVSRENGKVVTDAQGEVERGLEVVDFACGIPGLLRGSYSDQVSTGIDSYAYRQPLGVAVGVAPFNFPVMVPMWMHPVAIACGNAFVLKPSERVPGASVLVARLWERAGLPPGVFNVVHGDQVAVQALVGHPDVACVSFVGSTPVARQVHRAASLAGKRVQALGGAKNHAVVLPDADLRDAADRVAAAAYGSAGQRCMAVSVVVAVGPVAEPLVAALADRARAVRVGPGLDPANDMGPLVTAQARDRVAGYVASAARQGASVVVDGRVPPAHLPPGGFFLGPSLVDHVTPDMDVYRDEVFGPVLSVVRVPSLDDAINLVNANPYGNGSTVFTASGAAARTFQRRVTAGMVGVNVPIPIPTSAYSFGGWKDSLFGDHHAYGDEGVAFYTARKVVTTRWPGAGEVPAAAYHFAGSAATPRAGGAG